jgi:hypothetical protein
MYALIGIAIAVLAKALINFVTGWVGVNQGQGIFPTQ